MPKCFHVQSVDHTKHRLIKLMTSFSKLSFYFFLYSAAMKKSKTPNEEFSVPQQIRGRSYSDVHRGSMNPPLQNNTGEFST